MGTTNRPVAPKRAIKVPDADSFDVRGYSFNDALGLYFRHAGAMSALFSRFAGTAESDGAALIAAESITAAMIGTAPGMVAEIIAVGAGAVPESEQWEADLAWAEKLPAGSQMAALQTIGDLTFTSDMPPGKFVAVVLEMAKGATAMMLRPLAETTSAAA